MLTGIYLEIEHKAWMTAVAYEGNGETRKKKKALAKTENKCDRLIPKMRVQKVDSQWYHLLKERDVATS